MRVQDIMSTPIEATTPEEPAEAAWRTMKGKGIRHIVVREDGRVVGMLTSEDVGGARGAAMRRDCTVGDLMTPSVVTVSPTTTVRKAANLMRGRSAGALVVIARGRPVGIVTTSDLLALVGHGGGTDVKRRPLLNHRVAHRKRHMSAGSW